MSPLLAFPLQVFLSVHASENRSNRAHGFRLFGKIENKVRSDMITIIIANSPFAKLLTVNKFVEEFTEATCFSLKQSCKTEIQVVPLLKSLTVALYCCKALSNYG